MDDDQLQMLQRQFMSVQQQKTNPLAQRTVAQIMVKLHHQGFRFYPTTDGNQYLTPERLDKQILDLILERGHINVGILPQILNIGIDTIESRIIKLLTKYSSESTNLFANKSKNKIQIFRHNNLLLSQKYLSSIIETIKQQLIIQGKANLNNIAMQNQFNMKFTQKFINQNIQILNAQLFNNQLITKEYNLMKKVKLLGFLRAISNPISFQNIIKSSNLSQNDDLRTLQKLLQQIIQQNLVKGKYQNSYYIPNSFLSNQKQRILLFLNNNGFIQFEMLKKQFLVSNPQQWFRKNLSQNKKQIGDYVIFEDVCIKASKLEAYAHQIEQLLKIQGFLQISNVLPFNLDQKQLQKFFKENCKLGEYILFQGYCYSEKWLQKVIQQFKQKIFKSIFLTGNLKNDKKGGDKKNKGGKKELKSKLIQQEELIQKLYNQGLAQYSVAQNIAPVLLPILTKKLQQQKKKIEKDLSQSKGILNSSFLKYRSCNSIMRNIDGLKRNINIIQKQKKKSNQEWTDKQFGLMQSDQKGLYSIIYFDGVLPKNWPSLDQNLKWQKMSDKREIQIQSGLTSSCLFVQLLATIEQFNKINLNETSIQSPLYPTKQIQKLNKENPYIFAFYRNENDRRYIIVDNKLPLINNKLIGYSGLYGFAEKAYAKFRYCYKGILNLGIKTLLTEITGKQPDQYTIQNNNIKNIIEIIFQSLKNKRFIILIAQGQTGKKIKLNYKNDNENNEQQISAMKPYLCIQKAIHNEQQALSIVNFLESQNKNNSGQKLIVQNIGRVFKNVYIL